MRKYKTAIKMMKYMTADTNAPMSKKVFTLPADPSWAPSPREVFPSARLSKGSMMDVVNAWMSVLTPNATIKPTATTTTFPPKRKFLKPLSMVYLLSTYFHADHSTGVRRWAVLDPLRLLVGAAVATAARVTAWQPTRLPGPYWSQERSNGTAAAGALAAGGWPHSPKVIVSSTPW